MDIRTTTTATATTTTATAAMMTTMIARVATTAARLAAGATTTDAARAANMPLRGTARSTDGPVLAHGPGRRSIQRYQRRCLAARLTNTAALAAADPVLPHSSDLFSPTNQIYSSGGSSPALEMARDHLRHCRLRPAAPATALSGISPMPGISPADYSYVERGLRRFRSRGSTTIRRRLPLLSRCLASRSQA